MAGTITLRDLHDLRTAITDDMRHEVARAETGIYARMDEFKANQADLGRRLTVLEHRPAAKHAPFAFSVKQKTALWSLAIAVAGALLDGVRHLAALAVALWAKGVHP